MSADDVTTTTGQQSTTAEELDAAAQVEALRAQVAELKGRLAERTEDLQRLQAEYVNYKKRVDRDRDLARRGGVEKVLGELLPVLDAIRLADEHGQLDGPVKVLADQVLALTTRHGMTSFGEVGDAFDRRRQVRIVGKRGTDLVFGRPVPPIGPIGFRQRDDRLQHKFGGALLEATVRCLRLVKRHANPVARFCLQIGGGPAVQGHLVRRQAEGRFPVGGHQRSQARLGIDGGHQRIRDDRRRGLAADFLQAVGQIRRHRLGAKRLPSAQRGPFLLRRQ